MKKERKDRRKGKKKGRGYRKKDTWKLIQKCRYEVMSQMKYEAMHEV